MRRRSALAALVVTVVVLSAACVVPEDGGDDDLVGPPPSLPAEDAPTTLDPGLAALAGQCEQDGGAACDDLWPLTEAGSELERLAASCGGRIPVPEGPDAAPSGDCMARAESGASDTTSPSTAVSSTVTRGSGTGPEATTTAPAADPTEPSAEIDPALVLGPPQSGVWIAILMSSSEADGGQEFADKRANVLRAAEVATGVFNSGRYPGSLNDGFWVVYTGPFDSAEEASKSCAQLAASVPDCYPRKLEASS